MYPDQPVPRIYCWCLPYDIVEEWSIDIEQFGSYCNEVNLKRYHGPLEEEKEEDIEQSESAKPSSWNSKHSDDEDESSNSDSEFFHSIESNVSWFVITDV